MDRQLADRASLLFKFGQALGASRVIPDELDVVGVTPLNLSTMSPEDGVIDLSKASLPSPVGIVQTTTDLLRLIENTLSKISNPQLFLGEKFLRESLILSANIGATKPHSSLELLVSAKDLAAHQDRHNVTFYPGALVDSNYTLHIIANMRSTGLRDFVAVETTSKANDRIFVQGNRINS